jgi:hypothetical protein
MALVSASSACMGPRMEGFLVVRWFTYLTMPVTLMSKDKNDSNVTPANAVARGLGTLAVASVTTIYTHCPPLWYPHVHMGTLPFLHMCLLPPEVTPQHRLLDNGSEDQMSYPCRHGDLPYQ